MCRCQTCRESICIFGWKAQQMVDMLCKEKIHGEVVDGPWNVIKYDSGPWNTKMHKWALICNSMIIIPEIST